MKYYLTLLKLRWLQLEEFWRDSRTLRNAVSDPNIVEFHVRSLRSHTVTKSLEREIRILETQTEHLLSSADFWALPSPLSADFVTNPLVRQPARAMRPNELIRWRRWRDAVVAEAYYIPGVLIFCVVALSAVLVGPAHLRMSFVLPPGGMLVVGLTIWPLLSRSWRERSAKRVNPPAPQPPTDPRPAPPRLPLRPQ